MTCPLEATHMSNGTPARARISAVLALAATLVGAACGGESTSAPASGPSAPSGAAVPSPFWPSGPKVVRHVEVVAPEPTPATDRFPVSIEHGFGSTVIAEEPRRVVALGTFDNDTILALGVTPLTIHPKDHATLEPVNEWADFSVDGAAVEFLTGSDPNYELISGLKPDLIVNVSSITTDEDHAGLSKIAPMITRNDQRGATSTTWQDQTRMLGRALGRSSRADSLISDLEKRIAAIAADNPSFAGKTVVVAQYDGAGEPLNPAFQASGIPPLLASLGFLVSTHRAGSSPRVSVRPRSTSWSGTSSTARPGAPRSSPTRGSRGWTR